MFGSTDKKQKEKSAKVLPQDPRLSEEAKIAFESELLRLNLELSRLRSIVADLEKSGEEQKQKQSEGTEDRDDVIEYLTRTIAEREEELAGFKKNLASKKEEKTDAIDKLKKIEDEKTIEFDFMYDQLENENISLENKLKTMILIQQARTEFFILLEKQQNEQKLQAERHKSETYNLEMKYIYETAKIEKSINEHLEGFREALEEVTPLRIAAREHGLIKNNIIISNMLVNKLEDYFKINTSNEKLLQKNKNLKERQSLICSATSRLRKRTDKQLKQIEELAKNIRIMIMTEENIPDCAIAEAKLNKITDSVKIQQNIFNQISCLNNDLTTKCLELIKNLKNLKARYEELMNTIHKLRRFCYKVLRKGTWNEADKVFLIDLITSKEIRDAQVMSKESVQEIVEYMDTENQSESIEIQNRKKSVSLTSKNLLYH